MKNRMIFCFLLSIVACSCIAPIDIETDDASPRLVIYGYITTDAKHHSIRITRLAGYFNTENPVNVSGATVTISDDDGNTFHLDENPDEPGLYQTAGDVSGEEGKTYTLDVHADMQHYRASAHLTAHIKDIGIDSVRLRTSQWSENRVEVLLFAEDFPEDHPYSIFVSVNDSILNPTMNRFRVRQNIISGMTCYIIRQSMESDEDDEDRFLLRPGDKVTVNINAISQAYADFISAAQTELRGSIPIFGGPPANVPTNIESVDARTPAIGFFTAFPSRYGSVVHE